MEREQAVKFIYDLLRALLAKKGSDLLLTAGFPPAMKIDSKMTPVSQTALTGQQYGMQTLDQNLTDLVKRNVVSVDEARSKAMNKDNFK